MKKSGITEAMVVQAVSAVSICAFQYFNDQEVSQIALTAAISAALPLILRVIDKKRGG